MKIYGFAPLVNHNCKHSHTHTHDHNQLSKFLKKTPCEEIKPPYNYVHFLSFKQKQRKLPLKMTFTCIKQYIVIRRRRHNLHFSIFWSVCEFARMSEILNFGHARNVFFCWQFHKFEQTGARLRQLPAVLFFPGCHSPNSGRFSCFSGFVR